MPNSRSRSASPQRDRNPAQPRPKKQKTGGFKWKEKRPQDDDSRQERDSGALDRGYRNRSPRRENFRDHDREIGYDRPRRRDEVRGTDRKYKFGDGDRGGDSYRPSKDLDRVKDNESSLSMDKSGGLASEKPKEKTEKTEKKKKPKPAAPISSEDMIVVTVNDRLGTKAAIPCLASDSIKSFKFIVAAHVGRAPHEILLKRQGERPFKDQLTLEDYGVSNGVQLDLELDTGD